MFLDLVTGANASSPVGNTSCEVVVAVCLAAALAFAICSRRADDDLPTVALGSCSFDLSLGLAKGAIPPSHPPVASSARSCFGDTGTASLLAGVPSGFVAVGRAAGLTGVLPSALAGLGLRAGAERSASFDGVLESGLGIALFTRGETAEPSGVPSIVDSADLKPKLEALDVAASSGSSRESGRLDGADALAEPSDV